MTELAKISCRVAADEPGLTVIVKLDDQTVWEGDPNGEHDISFDINDNLESSHVLSFELAGKTTDHTKIDSQGKIIQDIVVRISDIAFDGLKLGHMITEKSIYIHDFNGSGSTTRDKFFGIMGCNGIMTLNFSTPIYLWLLENM